MGLDKTIKKLFIYFTLMKWLEVKKMVIRNDRYIWSPSLCYYFLFSITSRCGSSMCGGNRTQSWEQYPVDMATTCRCKKELREGQEPAIITMHDICFHSCKGLAILFPLLLLLYAYKNTCHSCSPRVHQTSVALQHIWVEYKCPYKKRTNQRIKEAEERATLKK